MSGIWKISCQVLRVSPIQTKQKKKKKKKFLHTLYESEAEQEKGDVMEDGDGKLELLPRKGTATSEKPRDEGSKVKRPTQLSLTCESPSLFA